MRTTQSLMRSKWVPEKGVKVMFGAYYVTILTLRPGRFEGGIRVQTCEMRLL